MYVLIHSNRQRVKSDDEIAREIKIIGEELLKERKLGRPSKDGKTKPKGPIRKQIAETLGVSEGKIQYIKRKEIELQEIKMHDEKLYNKVDYTEKELDEFVGSFNTEQLGKIMRFFATMPTLKTVVKVTNPKTKVESEVVVHGLQSFLA